MSDESENRPRFYVEPTGAEAAGGRFEVGPDGLLVGRSPACDLAFPTRPLASRHAYFYRDGDSCFVEDIGSAGEVFVNGEEVHRTWLDDGDVVDVGGVRLRFHVEFTPVYAAAIGGAVHSGLDESPAAASGTGADPLAIAAIVFAVMAYHHWAFGISAVVLALFSMGGMGEEERTLGRRLARAALIMGLVGGLLNAWFEDVGPVLQKPSRAPEELPEEAP
jgi:hypothetical protein